MASEQKNDLYNAQWPSDPKSYQWKGTLSVHNGTWNVLAHCKTRKQDVFLKIKQTQDDDSDIDEFTENTKNLINIQHENLLTPVHAFVHKSEIWVVYPRHSGGPMIEVLTSHYPNGIPDESIVSCILYDICLGLHNLHKQQQCHRNIRASSIHIDIDNGNALLTEFGELKEIKWKHAAGRRNTFVSPEREPFTDPLILFGDEHASWYAGDIYAFGITALQLVYGNTPPLNTKNIIQNRSISITTDLYDKKCPFSKSFELLIKAVCASQLKDRISINKLCEHKFFSKRAEHINIKQFFGHILKSTEKRINSSLQAPISFNYNGINTANNNENMDENKSKNTNKKQAQIMIKNGMKIAVEPNGNHTLIETSNNPTDSIDFTFSTSIRPEDLKNGDTPTQNQQQNTGHLGPTLHNQTITNTYNDPSMGHDVPMPTKKTRSYHVSFSESESISVTADGTGGPIGIDNNNSNNTVQINRFKVEFGSRLSESGTVATQIEPSETNDEPYDPTINYEPVSDEDQQQVDSNQSNDNTQQTIKIKRFHITPAKPDQSADECDDNMTTDNMTTDNMTTDHPNANANNNANNNQQQLQSVSPPQRQQQQQEQVEQKDVVKPRVHDEEGYVLPSTKKTEWSKSELSEWIGSFGKAFTKYRETFVDNAIDGSFMDEIGDEELKEIVPSMLHRKRILTAWDKLQK